MLYLRHEPCEPRQEPMANLKKIFSRKDILLIGLGSYGCLRGIALCAKTLEAEGRFLPCPMSPMDIALGRAPEKLSSLASQIPPEIGGIIVYLSCAEILSHVDAYALKASLAPLSSHVLVLERGPLVARRASPMKDIEAFLAATPEGEQVLLSSPMAEVPPPDYVGAFWEAMGAGRRVLLITPGGCASAIGLDETRPSLPWAHTTLNDLDWSMGAEEKVLEAASSFYRQDPSRPLTLITTAVPHILGFDLPSVVACLQQKGFDVRGVATDGFSTTSHSH